VESIYVLAIVVLGGMGHIPGVILGGILLVGFQELLRAVAEPLQTGMFGQVSSMPKCCASCCSVWPWWA
jgi:branched-chain amino acid transport system permease protein